MEKKGFTLMESVIAIGVVAILLTTFLAIFGPATQGIRRAISAEDADRLIASLEKELSILRENEAQTSSSPGGDYTSAFDKAYEWIKDSSFDGTAGIVLFNYRSDVTDLSASDRKPAPITGDVSGTDYVVTATAEFFDGVTASQELRSKLPAVVGPLIFIKTTQLVYDSSGKLELGEPGIKAPRDGQANLPGDGSDSFPEATLAYNAEFHLLPTNSVQYLEDFQFDDLGKPLFNRNLAVRR